MKKTFRYLDIIIALFAVALLISNLSATKLVAFGPVIADGGVVLFPLVYILGDILTEVYGYKYARRAIWIGFITMVVAVLTFTAVRFLPGAAEYQDQAAFEAVLGFFPRIVLASLAGYLIGSFINSYVMAKLKVKTKGKRLWQRLVASTALGGVFDTLVFCLVAFGGIIGASDMAIYILVGLVFKVVVEIILLPVTYRVVAYLKQHEGVDVYDRKTDFSPIKNVF